MRAHVQAAPVRDVREVAPTFPAMHSSSRVVDAVPSTGLSTPVLVLMAIACGLCAGGNYFNQPLLHSISVSLQVSQAMAALTVTMAQVAYAAGLLFLVPLGDKLERRSLAVGLMLLAALGQFTSGFAVNFAMLSVGTLMAGLFSAAAQILVPMAAVLADPARSGRAVGILMSGLLVGILTARSVAGLLSDVGGWSLVYRLAGAVMLVVALALRMTLPTSRNAEPGSYAEVMTSMLTLVRKYPRLRSRSLLGALSFASVSALFSTMALLLSGPDHELSDAQIGLVGLVGVAGAFMANIAGRLADKGLDQATTAVSVGILLLSWVPLWLAADNLVWFLVGMLTIDLALQGVHISNQNAVFRLVPHARSRVNSVYMTSYFAGAASGSAIGTAAWGLGGWPATCAAGVVLALLTCVAFAHDRRLAGHTQAV